MLKEIRASLKQFAGSVTAFAHKYRYDLFFRTELNIIALQVGFTLLVLILVALGFSILYRDISFNLVTGIMSEIARGATSTSEMTALNLAYLKDRNFLLIASAITVMTAIFGYLIARVTLAPTRNALESQKQFIGNVAHELRTPLSIIKTNTEVALFDDNLTPDLKETLGSTVEELDRISDIINNLLSLNVLVRPEKIPFGNVDVGIVVDRVVSHLATLIERKRLALSVEKSEYRTVWGNATALEQILMNVVKNAANYTPAGGAIRITIAPDYRGRLDIAIEDTGPGIPEKDLMHIFEPFYRADQSRARASGGSGLGLAIVHELVKLHRGRVLVKSAPGMGTSVMISLPCGQNQEMPSEETGVKEIAADFSRRSTQT